MSADNRIQRPSESMRERLVASLRNRLGAVVEMLADPALTRGARASLETEAEKLQELIASHVSR